MFENSNCIRIMIFFPSKIEKMFIVEHQSFMTSGQQKQLLNYSNKSIWVKELIFIIITELTRRGKKSSYSAALTVTRADVYTNI